MLLHQTRSLIHETFFFGSREEAAHSRSLSFIRSTLRRSRCGPYSAFSACLILLAAILLMGRHVGHPVNLVVLGHLGQLGHLGDPDLAHVVPLGHVGHLGNLALVFRVKKEVWVLKEILDHVDYLEFARKYFVSYKKRDSFSSAVEFCSQQGLELALPQNEEENSKLTQVFRLAHVDHLVTLGHLGNLALVFRVKKVGVFNFSRVVF
ncbi:hypothetical protein F7725_023184 [Dissostichus mawsoni]|uniref:Uncharacterized protein n=1 Tax=Dissostichus mawsoni TaxID=36200 RepID=A0A7J5Z258_DISMA|nr:hypothetical protein F7725_023184 [Dissostichus mawsoni]